MKLVKPKILVLKFNTFCILYQYFAFFWFRNRVILEAEASAEAIRVRISYIRSVWLWRLFLILFIGHISQFRDHTPWSLPRIDLINKDYF